MGIDDMAPASGRMLREDGTVVNVADLLSRAPMARMTVSAAAPTDPYTGDLWYNTAGPTLMIYNGTAWAAV
jgi:hypothetical protein